MKYLGSEYKGGIKTDTFFDGTNLIEHETSDLSQLLENNKRLRNNGTNGFTKERDLRHIAELDMLTVMKLRKELNIDVFNPDDMPRLKQWLRSNPAFLTVDGRI